MSVDRQGDLRCVTVDPSHLMVVDLVGNVQAWVLAAERDDGVVDEVRAIGDVERLWLEASDQVLQQ